MAIIVHTVYFKKGLKLTLKPLELHALTTRYSIDSRRTPQSHEKCDNSSYLLI